MPQRLYMRPGAASPSIAAGAVEGFWDTSSLAPGTYVVRVHARDVRGNEAIANRDLKVVVEPPANGVDVPPAALRESGPGGHPPS